MNASGKGLLIEDTQSSVRSIKSTPSGIRYVEGVGFKEASGLEGLLLRATGLDAKCLSRAARISIAAEEEREAVGSWDMVSPVFRGTNDEADLAGTAAGTRDEDQSGIFLGSTEMTF
jgi:hypothetical protein